MARTASKKSQPTISRNEGKSRPLTRERIAADIAAFHKAGGHIEVLGNTAFTPRVPDAKAS